MHKKIISTLLVLCLVLGMLPTEAWAMVENSVVSSQSTSSSQRPTEKSSRQSTITQNATVIDSGDCGSNGSNIEWLLDNEGILTISGTGAMQDWRENMTPWARYRFDIKRVIISHGITHIGSYAFNDCALTHLELSESVQSLGHCAFWDCKNLTTLTIPASLKIEGSVFRNCDSVAYVKFTGVGDMVNYISTDVANHYTPWHQGSLAGSQVTIEIADGITSIGDWAFDWCENLVNISLPSSITRIGERAFHRCSSLSNIDLPAGVSIGNAAFEDCNAVTGDITISDVGNASFENCSRLTSVNILHGTSSIGNSAFANCSNLVDVTIPNTVTNIGSGVFNGCSKLSSIIIPESVTSVEGQIFSGCVGLKKLTIPGGLFPKVDLRSCTALSYMKLTGTGITGSFSFETDSQTHSFITVEIEEGITGISKDAFRGCKRLENITIPSTVVEIGDSAFAGCSNLNDIVLPRGVSVGSSAFLGYTGLLGDVTLLNIGNVAFSDCIGLTNVTILDGATSIGYGAFSGCNKLASITIPNSVISIGYNAFYRCTELSDIVIPGSVNSIEHDTFNGCSGLKSVVIRDGVSNISRLAFGSCTNLKTICFPSSITNIENYAFSNCSNLTDIYYSGSKTQWERINFNYNSELTSPSSKITIHYNSTGPDQPADNGSVMLLKSWDEATKQVNFYHNILSYTVTGETILPNEDLSTLVGRYVLADIDSSAFPVPSIVHSIQSLDSAIGTVSAITNTSITIDGQTYPLGADVLFPDALVSREVLYHILDGKVVSLEALNWSTGILDSYNSLTGVMTIDGEDHYTCFLTNFNAIDEHNLIGSKIGYAMNNGIIIQIDPAPVDPSLPSLDEFEVNVYRANTLIHPPYSEQMMSLVKLTSPSRILVTEFSKNYWWLASTSVWTTFTNFMDTVSKPSNLYNIATKKRDFYETLIFDLLEVSTNYGYVDYAKDLIKEAKSWNGEIQNFIGLSNSWNSISDLSSDQKSLLEEVVKTKFIESYSDVHKDDIGGMTEGIAVINEVFSLSGSIMDVASSIEDYLETMATAFALVRMEDSLKAVVRQMLTSCPRDESALRDALRDIVTIMDATKEELFIQLMTKETEIVGWNASKQLIDDFWSKGVLKCSPEVQTLLKIYKTEKWLLNYLSGRDIDDIVEAGANVTNLVIFENLMLDVVSTLGGKFGADKTTDTATAYLSAVDIMFATWLKSCSTAASFEESLKSDDLFKDAIIPLWINLMNSNREGTASTLAEAVKDYEWDYISTYDQIWNGWIMNLDADYPNSGLYEKYKDLIVDFSEKYEANFVRKKIEIKCPVDILVYDKSNNLVAAVVAGDAQYDATTKDITIVVEGNTKTLYLYDDANYCIECVGTDTGSMDVIVTEYDDGAEVREVYFYDLPLTDGKTFEMSIDDKILGNADYELETKGETLVPDLDTYAETSEQYTLTVVSGTVSNDDKAVFEGTYYAGELIEVTALIDDNQIFTGWNSNSSDVVFTNRTAKVTDFRMPAKDVVVKAEISGYGYAVYLDGNGGTPESAVVATNLNGKLDTIPTATYAGHTLLGWYTAKEGGEEVTTSTVFSKDTTIYAQWTPVVTPPVPTMYTVTFDANGGTVTMTTDTTGTNGKLAALPIPTRDGYTFNGWYTLADGGEKVDESKIYTANTTLYAHWTKTETPPTPPRPADKEETYYINIPKTDNGEIIPSTRYAKDGERVTLTAHPNAGYELDSITITNVRGREITLRDLGDDRYSFTMPNSRVSVDASFAKIADNTFSVPAEDEPFTGLGTPGISGIVLNPSPMPFTDVHANNWFYNNVEYMWKHYLMSGVSDTQFAPNTTTSRAMIWTVLARMNNVRTDINPGSTWYERGMLWAMERGITDGTNPMDNITREQLATMLWRNAGSPNAANDLTWFSDSSSVSGYALTAVRWAAMNGILQGTDRKLNPKETATRAEVAAMVMRYAERIGA